MQNKTGRVYGNLKISREVLETIARTAALEVEGVAGFASIPQMGKDVKGWLFKKQPLRPIVISLQDGVAHISLFINVSENVCIPNLGRNIQSSVKEAVESMTGIHVGQVHVNVMDMVAASGGCNEIQT